MEQSASQPNENALAIAAVEQKILQIRQNIAMMGGNDAEFSQLNDIHQSLRKGRITPEDALLEAEKIEASKMDYH